MQVFVHDLVIDRMDQTPRHVDSPSASKRYIATANGMSAKDNYEKRFDVRRRQFSGQLAFTFLAVCGQLS